MLIDSHCHLDYLQSKYGCNLDVILQEAKANDVDKLLTVCVNVAEFSKVLAIAKKYSNVFATVGQQPSEEIVEEPTVETLVTLANDPLVIAIGETGLDYHYNYVVQTLQQKRFRNHIQAAIACTKPLVIHSRNAKKDTIDILREENASKAGGVMHCFTEDWQMAKQALDLGFYISFSGIITFKNADALREVVKKVPLDRMLIETDSPYLAPVPFRGKMNQPAYVHIIAEHMAHLKDVDFATIAEATNKNFFKLFIV